MLKLDKTHLIVFLIGVFLGAISAFFTAKAIYDRPMVESVSRDTVTLHDTIPQFFPKPVEVERLKYVTKFFPVVKPDTIHHFAGVSNMMHDTVAVEVPITSKHYKSEQYDAYISGFEPNLDSIFVYQKTEYITETIERTVKPKRKPWGIGFHAGYGYDFKSKTAAPFIGVGISYDIISF